MDRWHVLGMRERRQTYRRQRYLSSMSLNITNPEVER
jgi:hypothetical protein